MEQAVEAGATDLHIKVGGRPRIRVSGTLSEIGEEVITQEIAHFMALDLISVEKANRFELEGDVELTTSLEKAGRFRINIYRQQGYTGIAIRCIPDKIPTIDSLGLSPVAVTLAEKPHGLVLVTGPTGSGKSTTLAAMIHHINKTRSCNIITMEDPIEYLHHDIKALINQREIGADVLDFATALKRCLRQDPDVIMVGEMRDLETISLALTAAETGHLVFATLHTTSAAQTPSRIIDVFPPMQHAQIQIQLADSLQGIMSQILLPRKDGGLVLAQEVLVASEGIRALIRDNRIAQIDNLLQTGGKEGMQTMETHLNTLVDQGLITYQTALSKANNPKQIQKPTSW
jgi:twitching motility protein PilT